MLTRATNRIITAAALLIVGSSPLVAQRTYMSPGGYVPDAATAIKIAVAVWEPIYGRKQIQSQKPFRATLRDGVWTVYGCLPPNTPGGVAEADISKKDGRVLRVIHSK
jgi:NTF2 fold immunity protein